MVSDSAMTEIHALQPWNPVDQVRLLWWLTVDRRRFEAFRIQVGEETTRSAVAWLVSSLISVPSLIVVLCLTLTSSLSMRGFLWVGAALLIWFVNGLIGKNKYALLRNLVFCVAAMSALIGILALSSTLGMTLVEPYALSPLITLYYVSLVIGLAITNNANINIYTSKPPEIVITFIGFNLLGVSLRLERWIVIMIALFGLMVVVASVVDRSAALKHPSISSRFVFFGLFFIYGVLAWVYLLGGWQILPV